MIELPSLYPHQEELRDRTRVALSRHRRVILCAATGLGKTRTAKWILGARANREPASVQSGRSLFCVQRRGLVDNAIDSFREDPAIPHGVIMSGRETAYGRRIQVASIDTLLNWFIEDGEYRSDVTFDLIIVDEAHSHHVKYAKFIAAHDKRREELGLHPAYVIGLTATPEAKGLADLYNKLVLGPSTQWLIDNGYLSPFRYFQATQGQLGKLVKSGSGFTEESEAAAMDGLAGDLVRDWKKYAEGRPTVGFFPRRSHAMDAMAKLKESGIDAAYIDGDTDDDERRSIFRMLNEHRIDYLCSVQVVERGTDIPAISCIQLCVAVRSMPRIRQMIGRGARVHHSKTDTIVLDHGGNIQRHGFFEDDPRWTLDASTKDSGEVGARPTIACPKCNAIYRGGKCSACGYEPTPKERKSQGLTFDGSELKEVKPEKKASRAKTPEELMVGCMFAAGRSGRTWAQCVGMYRSLCRKQGTPEYPVPAAVEVGGRRHQCVRYGSVDAGRKVSALYPWTKRRK